MSRSSVTEFSMEWCLPNLPYEILFEIFKELPKRNLIEISKLSSSFRDVAMDERLWKDVHFRPNPEPKQNHLYRIVPFEHLYSGPWPIKTVNLSDIQVLPPVSPQTDQVFKVTTLNLTFIMATTVTVEAILAKYQCTELRLDCNPVYRIMGISPETFSKQNALEVLSLQGIGTPHNRSEWRMWLTKTLSNCKNLKSLNLGGGNHWNELDMLAFVKHLPTSLEKLLLDNIGLGDCFFESLAESTPNLKELEISPANVKFPSLAKLQFLETLRVPSPGPYRNQEISDLRRYIIELPALKTVYLHIQKFFKEYQIEGLRATLERNGIILRPIEEPGDRRRVDGNSREISQLNQLARLIQAASR